LQDLRARRTQLETRSQGLDAREALLAAAERRLNERVEQLATLQAKLEQLEAGRRERDEANWRGLVKTYETMRPRDAASIFTELDTPVLLQVLDRMKEAKAAPILAAMTPERARAVTAQLAEFRAKATAAPVVGEQGGKS
jgi:flagellar motility protein MotE (MotC chaperone)